MISWHSQTGPWKILASFPIWRPKQFWASISGPLDPLWTVIAVLRRFISVPVSHPSYSGGVGGVHGKRLNDAVALNLRWPNHAARLLQYIHIVHQDLKF